MLVNNLDGLFIIKWSVPNCMIVFKKDSKILKEDFGCKEEAFKFCVQNGITTHEFIGKGWKERVNGTMPSL